MANLVIGTVLSLYAALSLVAMMAMPVYTDRAGSYTTLLAQNPPHGYVRDPLLGIVSQLPAHVLATGMRCFVGLVAAAVLVVACATALSAGSRLICSLAQHAQLPARAAAHHREYGTPVLAITAPAIAAGALLLPGIAFANESSMLGGVYVYGAMLSFTTAQVAIVALRWSDPHRHRPVRVRWNIPLRGRRIPIPVVVGAVATSAAWIVLLALSPPARLVGSAWMVLGTAGYIAYRRSRGLDLTERHERDITTQMGPEIEIAYRSILIPVSTDQAEVPSDMVDIAVRLAAEHRAWIVLLAFTEVPLSEEMDVEIPGLEERVRHLAAQARGIGDGYGVRVHTTHLRTREPADAILAEADRRNSEIIMLGATGPRRTTFRGLARNQVTRRVTAESGARVMFVQPEPVGR